MPKVAARHSASIKPRRKRARKTRTAVISSSSSSNSSASEDDSDSEVAERKQNEGIASPSLRYQSSKDSSSSSCDSSDSLDLSESDSDSQFDEFTRAKVLQGHTKLDIDLQERRSDKRRIVNSPPPEVTTQFPEYDDKFFDELRERVDLKAKWLSMIPPCPVLRPEIIIEAREKKQKAIEEKEARLTAYQEKRKQTVGDSESREEDFKAMWLRLVVDEFGEELDALRKKEPSLSNDGPGSRMPLLIDALQAGSELFSRGRAKKDGKGDGLDEIDEVGLMLWKSQNV